MTPVKIVGATNWPPARAGAAVRAAAQHAARALRLGDLDVVEHLLGTAARVATGPTLVSRLHRVADRAPRPPPATSRSTKRSWIERCSSSREPAMQVCPVAAKMPEITPEHRRLELGIVEHDVRRLAAELERHVLQAARGRLVDLLPGEVRAGEGDLRARRDARPARRPPRLPIPVTMLTTPGGKPASSNSAHELQRRGRGELRRLDHRDVAGRKRRRELPGQQQQRRVPRRDHAHDAERLVARVVEDVVLVGRDDARLRACRRARRSSGTTRRCSASARTSPRSACRCRGPRSRPGARHARRCARRACAGAARARTAWCAPNPETRHALPRRRASTSPPSPRAISAQASPSYGFSETK